jgi:tetratricopeptide (TPR) repeat protein
LIVPTAVGLCFSCLGTGRFDKVVDIVPGVLQLIEKQGRQSEFFAMHVNPYSQLCAYCGQSMGFLGNFEEGRIFLEKGLRHAAQVGDLASSGLVEFCYGVLLHIKGEWKPAIEHLRNSIKHCEEAKFLAALAWSWAFLGSVYSNLGDPETGRSYVEKGLKIQQDSGFEYLSYICPFFLSEIYLQLGDLKNARSSADEALTLSLRISDKFGEGVSRINLGRMLLWQAETVQTDKAEEYILQGMMIMDELKLRPNYGLGCLFLGEFYVHVGRKEKAVEDLKKAEAMFQEMGMDYWLGKSQEVLKRL